MDSQNEKFFDGSLPLNMKRSFERLQSSDSLAQTDDTTSPTPIKKLKSDSSVVQNFLHKLDHDVEDQSIMVENEEYQDPIMFGDVFNFECLQESSTYTAAAIEKLDLTPESFFLLHHLSQKKVPALLSGTQFPRLRLFQNEARLLSWLTLLLPMPIKEVEKYMEPVKGSPLGSAIWKDAQIWSQLLRIKLTGAEPELLQHNMLSFIEELAQFDHTVTTTDEKEVLEMMSGISATLLNKMELLSKQEWRKQFGEPYIHCHSVRDQAADNNGFTYNFAWCTKTPTVFKELKMLHPILAKDRRSVPGCYGVPYEHDGSYGLKDKVACLESNDFTMLRELFIKKCLVRFLLSKGLSKFDIAITLNIDIESRISYHPFFFLQEIMLGHVPSEMISVQARMGSKFQDVKCELVKQANSEPATMIAVLNHLSMALMSYSEHWLKHRARVINLFLHRHHTDDKRTKSLIADLSKVPEIDTKSKLKEPQDLDRLVIDPILRLLFQHRVTTQEAMNYLFLVSMDPTSNISCSRLPYIAEKLEKVIFKKENLNPNIE